MNKYQQFGKIAEQIVFDLLNDGKQQVKKLSNKGPGTHGDFKKGQKTIESKGWWTDENTKSKKDYPSRAIQLSGGEWRELQKNPKKFELWAVYRLDRNHKINKGFPVRYSVMPGEVLKKCKIQQVTLRTTYKDWDDSRVIQKDVPLRLKKKYNLHKNEK